MIRQHGEYEIDDELSRVDFAIVHEMLTNSYWCPGISRERIEKGAKYSAMVVAAYHDGQLVGFERVVSDRIRFAYLCDVIVSPEHQGKGIARAMTQFALDDPDLRECRWLLATKDAHGVYATLGFEALPKPERWMAMLPKDFYDPLAEPDTSR
ncbi:MAG: GNAT family N-acetyltransferase [Fimbriimonadaceae bacterium]|nr:GNAT family N-acetyltransferase [Fimbriimonadaceae bacterium]